MSSTGSTEGFNVGNSLSFPRAIALSWTTGFMVRFPCEASGGRQPPDAHELQFSCCCVGPTRQGLTPPARRVDLRVIVDRPLQSLSQSDLRVISEFPLRCGNVRP